MCFDFTSTHNVHLLDRSLAAFLPFCSSCVFFIVAVVFISPLAPVHSHSVSVQIIFDFMDSSDSDSPSSFFILHFRKFRSSLYTFYASCCNSSSFRVALSFFIIHFALVRSLFRLDYIILPVVVVSSSLCAFL